MKKTQARPSRGWSVEDDYSAFRDFTIRVQYDDGGEGAPLTMKQWLAENEVSPERVRRAVTALRAGQPARMESERVTLRKHATPAHNPPAPGHEFSAAELAEIRTKIAKLRHEGSSEPQAVAIAYNVERRKKAMAAKKSAKKKTASKGAHKRKHAKKKHARKAHGAPTSGKLAAARKAVSDMEKHLHALEGEARQVRSFLRANGAKKKRPKRTKRAKR